ncbi:transcriptional regulator [Acidithiobacillus ferriphilus]|uniref:Transcriptional regulator n=2 Tax=Acidithiobacillus TaxID=119977 RepID=A0ACD5IEE9_9PROT|nr:MULTISPECIES: transcriptional regulator [Acidithiobacillus]MBU2785872.1 transcriptional regulator [Acidithiobacillus ferriphilus]MBU2814088.1 transcriptional regulator [Acidithiobacillus ferruginosus]MBU2855897.1 transcriptional regulator [Acidithiobacillus ferrooxidans]MBU2859595.1 transcriptional regulator [Acidithiobacillus ferrooxidans]
MEIKAIHDECDYTAALTLIDRLWDAPAGSPESDQLEVIAILIADYERQQHSIDDPDPIALLEHVMEARSLSRKDLEPCIGSRARVSEVLNRRRPLTLEMIRRLSEQLDLPAEILVRPYPTRSHAA